MLSISVSNFVNDGHRVYRVDDGWSDSARLNIVSPEFRNYGTIIIDGVAMAPAAPGAPGLVVTSSLFVNAGHLIGQTRGSIRINARIGANFDVVAGETWYGWIHNQGLIELGGSLDNSDMTLFVGLAQRYSAVVSKAVGCVGL